MLVAYLGENLGLCLFVGMKDGATGLKKKKKQKDGAG